MGPFTRVELGPKGMRHVYVLWLRNVVLKLPMDQNRNATSPGPTSVKRRRSRVDSHETTCSKRDLYCCHKQEAWVTREASLGPLNASRPSRFPSHWAALRVQVRVNTMRENTMENGLFIAKTVLLNGVKTGSCGTCRAGVDVFL